MKLKIKEPKQQDIKHLELVDNGGGTIAVMLEDWSLVTFGINDEGKIAFARNRSVEEESVDTDENGCINEIEEGEFVEQD